MDSLPPATLDNPYCLGCQLYIQPVDGKCPHCKAGPTTVWHFLRLGEWREALRAVLR